MINKFNIFNGAKYIFSRAFQNYLIFIPAKKYIKYLSGNTRIDLWKSSDMPEENIEHITKSDSNSVPTFIDHRLLPDINFNGCCLTLIKLGFLRVDFFLGEEGQFDPPSLPFHISRRTYLISI